jgi:hypothetical protein
VSTLEVALGEGRRPLVGFELLDVYLKKYSQKIVMLK